MTLSARAESLAREIYVVPPGIYQARALVDFIDTTDPNRPLGVFWSEPLIIEVVAQ